MTKTKSSKAAAFLAKAKIVDARTWAMTKEIIEIVDEANRRRLAGEASSVGMLARALKDAFDIPISDDALISRIKRHVRRSTW